MMSAFTEKSCTVCSKEVPESNQRRRLYGQPNVVSTLKSVLSSLGVSSVFLPSQDTNSFLCRNCSGTLTSLHNTREKESRLHEQLKSCIVETACRRNIAISVPGTGCEAVSPQAESQPSTSAETVVSGGSKRLAEPSPATPAAKRQQRRCNTPIRRLFQERVVRGSPTVSVVVKGKTYSKVQHLTSSLKKIGKGLGRKSVKSVAFQVMKHEKLKKQILKVLGRHIKKEKKAMCALKGNTLHTPSILRSSDPETVQSFKWELLIDEMKQKAPTLYSVLASCAHKKVRNKRRRSYQVKDEVAIGVCASVLLRHRNCKMNLLQRIMAMILYSTHAGKMVYRRLQKLLLCLSHPRTLAYVDRLGKDHDKDVKTWKKSIQRKCFGLKDEDAVDTLAGSEAQPSVPRVAVEAPVSIVETQSSTDQAQDAVDAVAGNEAQPSVLHVAVEAPVSIVITDLDAQVTQYPEESFLSSDPDSPLAFEEPFPSSSSSEDGEESPTSPTAPEYSPMSSSLLTSSSSESDRDSGSAAISLVATPCEEVYPTMKLVGDNIDKYVKPREMRVDSQASTLHFFNMYAVRDRVDTSCLEDEPSLPDPNNIDLNKMFLSADEQQQMHMNFRNLIARVLVKHMPFFNSFGSGLQGHIKHEHSSEMAKKSEVIPLGILEKCETKHEDMVAILEHLHQYVPTYAEEEMVEITGLPDKKVLIDHFHYLLFGGDLMTEMRAGTARNIRNNSERGRDRLEGLLPVMEDWHTKVCLLEVIFKRLYNCRSVQDIGTLYHLRNLINRRNVTHTPKNCVNACEEFFLLVVEGYILTTAMKVFGMSSLEDKPSSGLFPDEVCEMFPYQRRKFLLQKVQDLIIDKFVHLSYPASKEVEKDGVNAYSKDVISYGLLLMELNDAVREGDGYRIFHCHKMMLPIFKASGRTNYSNGVLRLLVQYNYLFTPRLQKQLLFSRTVNVHGKRGKNVSCDLHMEHINKVCKTAIGVLGPSISESPVQRIGKCVLELKKVLDNFDRENCVKADTGYHSKKSATKDLKIIVNALNVLGAASVVSGRKHNTFKKFQSNINRQLKEKEYKQWISEHVNKLVQ